MSLLNKLKKEMKRPLSDKDVLKICGNKAKMVTYPELVNFDNIDNVMGEFKACLLLYQSKDDFGHWCCFYRYKKKTIVYFDSYGLEPDKELKFIPEHYRKISDQDYPHLTWLFYNSPYRIEYNEYPLQKEKNNINTCGRWAGLKLKYRDIPLIEFIDIFKKYKKYNLDYFITALTINV